MPIVATGEFDLVDMVVLLCFIRPIQALFAGGREHGRTIPLAVARGVSRLRAPLPQTAQLKEFAAGMVLYGRDRV
jgi:hypothetical protein